LLIKSPNELYHFFNYQKFSSRRYLFIDKDEDNFDIVVFLNFIKPLLLMSNLSTQIRI